uniref:ATP synthase complex subunit 8 n=2 Tax=Cryptolestes TaxID=57999 RepID=A0A0U2MB28_9CUCU|nr:ATP synthase F0 subunit 8 [Cryptolestes ferrugineus]YP_009176425.1 ATP synthase F0 subunit 8 [Cryptolestes pusillus]ALI86990.1 ATP synthase F0 subunit 8 [Cryptolestes ferrugineus]ALI87006.1 ATP synthase F0 subunit 8 [Cryptolestes pusillus]
MPQMAPLSWLTLFFYFTLIFILFNIMNYYSFMYQVKKERVLSMKKKINWKW